MITNIALFICKLVLRKEADLMVAIYVALIIKGKKTFAQVPARLKEQVKQMLIDLDLEDLATE